MNPRSASSLVLDRFRILEVLTQDRSGFYAHASDQVLDRRVTIRVHGPAAESERGRRAARRLARELRTLTVLRHPAAPRLYDVLEGDALVVVVMEPIEVPRLLDSVRPPCPETAVQVAGELLGVLAEAHALGLVHRAVTCRAVAAKRIDGERGAIKLLGWGRLADLGEVPSATGEDEGQGLDPEWAPEAVLGDEVDARTDVYGVGSVAYRLLVGRPVIATSDPRPEVVMRELLRADRSIRLDGVSEELAAWVRRCLAIEPSARFGSAKEALDALPTFTARRGSVVQTRPATHQPALGSTIGSGFRIVEVLGRGGMGTVFLAEDLALERHVAIKLLHDVRPDARAALVAEARNLGRVKSPNVVHVYGVGEEAGVPFLVMEHVAGHSLEDELSEHPAGLPLDRVRALALGVGRGLRDLHSVGMVHGDVKPSNVMVDGDRTFLLDFGLVRPTLAFADGGAPREGTPAYMAPERIRGTVRTTDAALVDVYAAGVLFFELLTGTLPFEAASVPEMLDRHVDTEPPPVSSRRALSREVDAVIACALAKSPADRHPTIEAFSHALVEALDTSRRSIRSLSTLVVGDDPAQRRWIVGMLAERLGVRAVHEASRAASLPAARRLSPDVALLIGEDVLSLERAILVHSRTLPTTGVIAIAPAGWVDGDSLLRLGATAVLPPRFDERALRDAVTRSVRA